MYMSKLIFTVFLSLCFTSVAFFSTHPVAFSRQRMYSDPQNRKYPISKTNHELYIKRLNSKNDTLRDEEILGKAYEFGSTFLDDQHNETFTNYTLNNRGRGGFRIVISPSGMNFNEVFGNMKNDGSDDDNNEDKDTFSNFKKRTKKKSENFEVITDFPINFSDVGGYDNVKQELLQCVDILSNYKKYTKFNVRIPKGLIFEGPPGNGKTMLAKALAGQAKIPFITVSGAQFQEKYVGVGSSRVRELFDLAKMHAPVIVFIDEIDAIGRKRSGDGEQSSSERDNTLNELLVAMDGFKNSSGVFLVGATNRADLLDPALLRPGRIDKRIYVGNPDAKTREQILRIHIRGKPYEAKISIADLVDTTAGLSGAQIENLVNEAMLNALRCNREMISSEDIDFIMNKMMVGWQPMEHQFTSDIIDHIAIHEMGHAVVGLLSKQHAKVSKVVINLSAPQSPGYTVFEPTDNGPINTREGLIEHLMILLGGRIAEETFYNVSVTTGAINDFSEALKLSEKMVIYYGLGKIPVYPGNSEKYKAIIDDDVLELLQSAYEKSERIIREAKDFIYEGAELLKKENVVHVETLNKLMKCKYRHLLSLD